MLPRFLAKIALLLVVVCAFAGCVVSDRDVSRDPAFLVGYRPGQVYRLKQPVDLLEIDADHGELLPTGERRSYGKVTATLPAGTAIQIGPLRHVVSAAPVQWETGVQTMATLFGRPDYSVLLNGISGHRWVAGDYGMKTGVLCPDSKWLELESATPESGQ